jgi:hypothetical protein
MFKVGDKVKCIDDSGWGYGNLIKGKIYEVFNVDITDKSIKILTERGTKLFTFARRFVLYNEKRCIILE